MPAALPTSEVIPTNVPLELVAPGNGKVLVAEEKSLEQSGLARLSKKLVKEMESLGVDVTGAGCVKTDMGYAFGHKAAIYRCVEQLHDKLEGAKSEELHATADSLAKLAKAMNALASKNFSVEKAADEKPATPRRSFAAGQSVQFHNHLHVHKEEKPA